ncbi:MAG: hypothetical protein MRZ79_14500 [Bacteroidia bacterium]|nr:hypothetical protein [Bacteroidia bacterium]
MAALNKIALIHVAGIEQVEIPLQDKTLLQVPNGILAPPLIPLFSLLYQAELPFSEIEMLDYYFPQENSWVIFELGGIKSSFLLSFFKENEQLQAFFLKGSYEKGLFQEKDQTRNPQELLNFIRSHKWDHSEFIKESDKVQRILWGQVNEEKYAPFEWFPFVHYPLLKNILSLPNSNEHNLKNLIREAITHNLAPSKRYFNIKAIQQSMASFQKAWKDVRLAEEKLPQILKWLSNFQTYQRAESSLNELLGKIRFGREKLKAEKKQILSQQKANKTALNQLQKKVRESEATQSQNYKAALKTLGYWEKCLEIALKKQKNKPQKQEREENKEIRQEAILKKNRWIQIKQAKLIQNYAQELNQLEALAREKREQVLNRIEEVLKEFSAINTKAGQIRMGMNKRPDQKIEIESKTSVQNNRAHLEESLSNLELQRDLEIKLIQAEQEKRELQYQSTIKPFQERIDQLNQWLANQSNSFYGWLDNRYPGWQKTIGKVIKEDVLFQPNLNPSLVRLNDLLYGIQIGISELPNEAPTVEELNLERSELEKELEEQKAKFEASLEENSKQVQNLEKKYRSKIRQLKNSIQQIDIEIQQEELRRKKEEAENIQKSQVEAQITHKELIQIEYKSNELENSLETIRQEQLQINHRIQEEKQNLLDSHQEQLSKLEALYDQNLPDKATPNQQDDWEELWLDELNYISKIPFFEQKIKATEKEMLSMEGRAEQAKKLQFEQFQSIESDILKLNKGLEAIEKSLERSKDLPLEVDERESEDGLDLLLEQYHLLYADFKKLERQLTFDSSSIIRHFSEDNHLNIPTSSRGTEYFNELGKAFSTFKEEGIGKMKQAIGKNFSSLISQVAEQTKSLEGISPLFEKEITEINELLQAVSISHTPIQLESRTSLISLFAIIKEIHELNKTSGNQLGGISLFNPAPSNDVNQKALGLLEKLESVIGDFPQKNLDLGRSQHIVIPALGKSLGRLLNISLCFALSVRLSSMNKGLPVYFFMDRLEEFGEAWMKRTLREITEKEIKLVSTGQRGFAAADFDKILFWNEGKWS